ncbi:MAG: ferritin family protein [Chloroflexota bacterium]
MTVLKQGMSTEIWARSFYEQAVAHTKAEAGREIFQSLVEEEGRHLDYLRGQYAAVSGNKQWVSVQEAIAMAATVDPTGIFPQATAAGQLIPADSTDVQALDIALDFERRSYEMYTAAANAAQSLDEKAAWEWLARAEDKHFAFLQETKDFLVSNGLWFFDERELPFFEG